MLTLWREPHPVSPALAAKLKQLVMLQLSVFLLMIVLFAVAAITHRVPQTWSYIVGFGLGWVMVIRWYVYRYVPDSRTLHR